MSTTNGGHLDPTLGLTLKTVKERAVKGVVVLTGRTFFLSVVSLIATGLLTVFLEPSEFGVFWIVSAVVNFLAYFSDIGLAAALIQKKKKLSEDDLRTTFTVQQGLIFILLFILVMLTPFFMRHYGLSDDGKWLLYALGLSLAMSSFKTIPSVLLERELEFEKLVIPQVLENLVYNTIAVTLAWMGFGIMSFTYAVLARGMVGLVAIYIIKPWLPRLAFSKKSFRSLLGYGVPYQLSALLATVKDDGMTVVLGGILGPAGVGLLGWAQKWGQAPLRFFMDHVIKVTFPAFARMQDEKDHLKRSLERSILFICLLVFPSVAGLLIVAPMLVEIIPRYEKWAPALIPLFFISINTIFAAVTTQLTNLLNSIGKIKVTLKLMIMWVTLTWLFIPFLAIRYGINGAAFGYMLVGTSSVVAVYVARKYVPFSFKASFVFPAISSFIMFIILLAIRSRLSVSAMSVAMLVVSGMVIYLISTYFFLGSSIVNDVKKSFKTIFSR